MKTIIILCGGTNSGKTKTLKSFYGLDPDKTSRKNELFIKKMGSKIIYAVTFSSPQEQEDFCDVESVKKNIQERIQICERNSNSDEDILLIPFTVKRERESGEFNESCITIPIKWLKATGYFVHVIYLNKMRPIDLLMKKITSLEIESMEEYERQSRDLMNFLKNL